MGIPAGKPRTLAGRYARVAGLALQHWPILALIVALGIALSVAAALQPWPLKILVDQALAQGSSRLIVAAALASLALFAVSAALEAAATWAWSVLGQRMVYDLAGDLFLRMQRLSLAFHARRPVGDSITRITGDAWCVHAVADGLLVSPARHLVAAASVGALAWHLDPSLCLLALTAAPLLAASALYFGERLKGFERGKREAQARLAGFLHQVLGAMPLVQAFAAGPRNRATFEALAADAVKASRGSAVVESAYRAVNGVAITLGMALVLYAGGRRVLAHELSLGSLLVFVAYLRTLEGASRGLLQAYGKLRAAQASIDRVLEVLDAPAPLAERSGARALPEPARGHLVFEQVSYAYEPGRPVLDEIDLEVRPGETLALVGATGAGKSTLAALVLRFFDPTHGRVLLDGADLRDVQLKSLRREVSVVLQDAFLLPLSVAENIAYGCEHASREEIVAAAVAAHAHEFIRALPEGYDTVLGERGVTLSGGERQRLAIARAILRDARVLILDEPTSALDAQTESRVVQALEHLLAGRTTLVIAHRLSSVRRANRIAVLEEGRLVELGSHAELIAAGGRYAKLHALQELRPAASQREGSPPEGSQA
jgi:ATP-binding cassette subfamily B protein/subfamily B ATP-binding cassette protein MsbA